MRERLGDGEAPCPRLQVPAEQRERQLVARLRLGLPRGFRGGQSVVVVRDELSCPPDGVGQWLPVPGQREPWAEGDRLLERGEIVTERVGPARGPEPDGRGDRAEQ